MNQTLQSLLRLQELELLRQALQLAATDVQESGFDFLDRRIERVRREIPGTILSRYDSLRRSYTEPVAPASQNRCRGCDEAIPTGLALRLERSNQVHRCPHCGRFLYQHECAPDYVTTK